MVNKKHNKYKRVLFGALPVVHINATLEMDLEAGNVVMSANAQKHAANKHPEFTQCLAFASVVLANPLYLGDDTRNPGKIEIIGRPPLLGSAMLIAVEIAKDKRGNYNVTSIYKLKNETVENRKANGHLKIALSKK